jgi:hypothetical protein
MGIKHLNIETAFIVKAHCALFTMIDFSNLCHHRSGAQLPRRPLGNVLYCGAPATLQVRYIRIKHLVNETSASHAFCIACNAYFVVVCCA